MRAARRGARSGNVLARHLLLWWATGRTPTASAAGLCCSRSRVARRVRASRAGAVAGPRDAQGDWGPLRPTGVPAGLRLPRVALRQVGPPASGGGPTRWSGATRALTLPTPQGGTLAAETGRRWLQALGGGWGSGRSASRKITCPAVASAWPASAGGASPSRRGRPWGWRRHWPSPVSPRAGRGGCPKARRGPGCPLGSTPRPLARGPAIWPRDRGGTGAEPAQPTHGSGRCSRRGSRPPSLGGALAAGIMAIAIQPKPSGSGWSALPGDRCCCFRPLAHTPMP
jgi:hypothetical protein